MWGKCGVQNQKIGVWAWCLIIPFVVLKTPFCGVKNGVKILGGVEDVKNQPVPTYGKSMLRRNQIAATIIYCNVLLLQLELQYFNSLQQGTPLWEHSRNPFALAQHGHMLPGSRRCCETVKLSSETAGLSGA